MIIFTLAWLFTYPLTTFADLAANIGDVVIFNMPLRTEKIKVELYRCPAPNLHCDEKDWVPLTNPSAGLAPGAYTIFKQDQFLKNNMLGKAIGVRVYSFVENRWSNTLFLVKEYDPNEDPFYQFLCWSRHEAAPHFFCITGEEGEQDQEAQ